MRGHWKCSKSIFTQETEFSTPFVVKAATSLVNSLKFTWKALTFFCRETRGFLNFDSTYDEF